MKDPNTQENSKTVIFLSDGGKVNVFPIVKDYGIYRVLGPTAEMKGKYPEPQVGTRLPPKPLWRHKEGELAVVACELFDDDKFFFFIDYARKDRKRAHEAILESNLNMGKPRGLKACTEEMRKEFETNGPPRVAFRVVNGSMEISGLDEGEKARFGEERFNELNLIIGEMELYAVVADTRMVDDDDDGSAKAWKNA